MSVKLELQNHIKTLCQGQRPRGTRKNGQINVAFLLEKGHEKTDLKAAPVML